MIWNNFNIQLLINILAYCIIALKISKVISFCNEFLHSGQGYLFKIWGVYMHVIPPEDGKYSLQLLLQLTLRAKVSRYLQTGSGKKNARTCVFFKIPNKIFSNIPSSSKCKFQVLQHEPYFYYLYPSTKKGAFHSEGT